MLLISLFFWGIKHSNKLKVGTISFVYLIAYSCGRVWIEGFRTDSLMFGYLRVAQLVSLGAIAFGIFGLIWLYGLKNLYLMSINPLTFEFGVRKEVSGVRLQVTGFRS